MGLKQDLQTATSPVMLLQFDEMNASWSNSPVLATPQPLPGDRNLNRQGQPSSMPLEIGDNMVSSVRSVALAHNALLLDLWTPNSNWDPHLQAKQYSKLIPRSIPTGCKEARNRSRGLEQ
ncbi:hypothetical protein FAGAP_9808 [Fusarium agapanthi]|uniref:Uncharacterized protein n=1 Tax=Fusarium agapanthi TaxID=1803897 RepID=A0A9P5B3K9_9HYPO|nr:hypothetical protein FAGAP_9808 [Fusarium agapanthi]